MQLPHDIELEKTVLGGMIAELDGLNNAMPLLKNSDIFYSTANQYVFIAIKNLYDSTLPVDLRTVIDKLRSIGKLKESGGPEYILDLTNNIATYQIEYHCARLIEFYIKRKIYELGNRIITEATTPTTDAIELIDTFQNELSEVNSFLLGGGNEIDFAESINETLRQTTEKRENQIIGMPTGNGDLSAAICGWNKKLYYIFAGRPSHFKTTREIAFALFSAMEGKKVAIFSPDQSAFDLKQKMLSSISEVPLYKMRTQSYDEHELQRIYEAAERLKKLHILIDERSDCTPNYIKSRSKEYQRKYGLDLIIADNIHAMNPDGKRSNSEEANISSISRGIKVIPKQLDVALIALCHLNRECENRDDKRPKLSDLRYSGAIEQDADCVFYSYHPWKYYTEVHKDPDYSQLSQAEYYSLIEIGILKNKMGPIGDKIIEYVDKNTGIFYKHLDRNNNYIPF